MPKASKSPAFMFYPTEWLTSTAVELMPPEVEGTYIRLLCRQWIKGTLPADAAALRLLTKLSPAQWKKAWPLLAPHFPMADDGAGRQNPTLEGVRVERQAYLAKAAEHGKKGAEKRWGDDGVPYPDPTPDPIGCLSKPQWGNDDSGSGSGSGSPLSTHAGRLEDIPSPPAEALPWVHASGHEALAALFAAVSERTAWVGLLRGLAQGTTLGRPVGPLRLALAVQEFVASGKHREPQGPSPKLFQGFVKRTKEPETPPRQITDAEQKAQTLRELRERNDWCRRALRTETPLPAWAPEIDAMFPDGRTFPSGVAA